MSVRREKGHPPLQPTPRIPHLPRRSILFRAAKQRAMFREDRLGKKVEASSGDSPEERRRFQVNVLRAECNLLRMEREVALRKLEWARAHVESAFSSAIHTMISGRKKLDGMGSVAMALDAEIEDMQAMLKVIHGGFRGRRGNGDRSGASFSRRESVLRRRMEIVHEKSNSKETAFKKKDEDGSDRRSRFSDLEKLSTKMQGLSSGMRERTEENGLLIRLFNTPARDNRRLLSRPAKEMISVGICCKCKEMTEKIVTQLMAEAEEWGEMQEILDKVKIDMEDLRSSCQKWERRALSSEHHLHSVHSQMEVWKRRAIDSENAINRIALSSAVAESSASPRPSNQLNSEISGMKQLNIPEKQQISFQNAKDKHVVARYLIDSTPNGGVPRRRPPLKEISRTLPQKEALMFR